MRCPEVQFAVAQRGPTKNTESGKVPEITHVLPFKSLPTGLGVSSTWRLQNPFIPPEFVTRRKRNDAISDRRVFYNDGLHGRGLSSVRTTCEIKPAFHRNTNLLGSLQRELAKSFPYIGPELTRLIFCIATCRKSIFELRKGLRLGMERNSNSLNRKNWLHHAIRLPGGRSGLLMPTPQFSSGYPCQSRRHPQALRIQSGSRGATGSVRLR